MWVVCLDVLFIDVVLDLWCVWCGVWRWVFWVGCHVVSVFWIVGGVCRRRCGIVRAIIKEGVRVSWLSRGVSTRLILSLLGFRR